MSDLTPKQLYRREYYQKNKEKAKAQISARYLSKKKELLEYQRAYRQQNRQLVTDKNRAKRKQRLLDAITLLGGKCSICSQIHDPCVYDFHHTDPTQKDFTIGENMLVSKERFFSEINKCILVCANCHRIIHHKEKNSE